MIKHFCDICGEEIHDKDKNGWERVLESINKFVEAANPRPNSPNLDIIEHLPGIEHVCDGCKKKLMSVDIQSLLLSVIHNTD